MRLSLSLKTYRELLLLHLGAALLLHEAFLTPPPFDVTVGAIVTGLIGTTATLRRDERRSDS